MELHITFSYIKTFRVLPNRVSHGQQERGNIWKSIHLTHFIKEKGENDTLIITERTDMW